MEIKASSSQGEVFYGIILLWVQLCVDVLWFEGAFSFYMSRILETSLRDLYFLSTKVNTFVR